MDWQALGAIAGVIGALGTITGLPFVFRELRNVKRNQYATASQNLVDSDREIWQIVLSDDSMVELTARHLGFDSEFLKEVELTGKNVLELLLFFRQYENIYVQHTQSMLLPNIWDQWEKSMSYTFSDDRVWIVLERAKVGYTTGFREFIQDKIRPQSKLPSDQ